MAASVALFLNLLAFGLVCQTVTGFGPIAGTINRNRRNKNSDVIAPNKQRRFADRDGTLNDVQSISLRLYGRKIGEEDASMNTSSKKSKKKSNKTISISSSAAAKEDSKPSATAATASSASAETEVQPSSVLVEVKEEKEIQEELPFPDVGSSKSQSQSQAPEVDMDGPATDVLFDSAPKYSKKPLQTQDSNTASMLYEESVAKNKENREKKESKDTRAKENAKGKGRAIPPEEIFFGDPRNPPPVEASQDTKAHGSLLYWARHANAVPQTSEDRRKNVFPKGVMESQSSESSEYTEYRLDKSSLSYSTIYDRFADVMSDVEMSKKFISANLDTVPSKLFLRALTAEKLSAQSKQDFSRMEVVKQVRDAYILAHDQLFVPLNIEVQKAETRVMTFLAREEVYEWAADWDEIEMSLHMTTLLAARLTWDGRVRDILDGIKEKLKDTVGYMAEGMKEDLLSREFRKPAVTAEVYLNASLGIQQNIPDLYQKMLPEVKVIHETYFELTQGDNEAVKKYIVEEFCPKNEMTVAGLKQALQIYQVSLAAVQGIDYIELRLHAQKVYEILCAPGENEGLYSWYSDFRQSDSRGQFETYGPDEVPTMIKSEQRLRDTGNAFDDFAVQVLKRPTKYSKAFSTEKQGGRKSGKQVGNWLEKDPSYFSEQPESTEGRIKAFQEAYVMQSEARKAAESKLGLNLASRMEAQDRVLSSASLVMEVEEYGDFLSSPEGKTDLLTEEIVEE